MTLLSAWLREKGDTGTPKYNHECMDAARNGDQFIANDCYKEWMTKLTKETNVRAGGGLCLPSYKSPSAPMRFHVHDRSPLPTDIVLHGKPWTIEGVLRDKHGGENCGPYSGPETHV